jgi:hypothetical protein
VTDAAVDCDRVADYGRRAPPRELERLRLRLSTSLGPDPVWAVVLERR